MPARPNRQLVQAHTAYRDQTQAVRQRTQGILEQRWRGLPDYRDKNVEAFATSAARVVRAGQRATATLTAAFQEQAARQLTGLAIPAKLDLGRLAKLREGADPFDVYMRPARQVWWELSKGVRFDQAAESGLTRALTLAATDLQLAKTDAIAQTFEQDKRVLAYERVAGDAACELCAFASGQISKADEVMPIHDNCACTAIPIYDEARAADAQTINQIRGAAYDATDDRRAFANSMTTADPSVLPPQVQSIREQNLKITATWNDRFR